MKVGEYKGRQSEGEEKAAYYGGETPRAAKEPYGQAGKSLTRNLSSKRRPDLFDIEKMTARGAEMAKGLRRLQQTDKKYNIKRRGKPVYLTPIQAQIVYALERYISQPEELAKADVQAKLADPYNAELTVVRTIPVAYFTRLFYDRGGARVEARVMKEVLAAGTVVQWISTKDWEGFSPLIHVGTHGLYKGMNPPQLCVEVYFGGVLIEDLASDFAPIRTSLFRIWNKKGHGTELYKALQDELLMAYPYFARVLKRTRERIRRTRGNRGKTPEELDALLKEEIERKHLLDFTLTTDALKDKVTRDYESNRANRAAFWKDLAKAVEGQWEVGLITRVTPPIPTHPRKIVFTFSETYGQTPDEETPLLPPKQEPSKG